MDTEKEQNIWRRKIFIEGNHLVRGGDEEWRGKIDVTSTDRPTGWI